ncbi:MAG: threonylcarbamoyl-AMP synthase [Deltaproteobacteria bacterium]|nr:threonylcarbamoyl-AMP synthase [Deltaproteobacteria bacterium]
MDARDRIATNVTLSSRPVPRVLAIDPDAPSASVIAEAALVLARGGLVAFPTETVYGLGARGLVAEDVAKIFAAKERPTGHPLILHVDGEEMAKTLASSWSARASRLARAFWPGPLTMVVPRAEIVPDAVTGGLDSVAVRVPNHAVARALVRAVGTPLAAPSANAHMHVSPTTAEHVVRSLGDRVDLVLDGGPCTHGIESTVVDVRSDPPRVLRAGAATLEMLRAIEPSVAYETTANTIAGEAARASPGMASKHYAPRATVALVPTASFEEALVAALAVGRPVAAIAWSEEGGTAIQAHARTLVFDAVLPSDPAGYARGLFAAFYDADDAGAVTLVVEAVPAEERWWAVADRLRRATSAG